MFRKSRQKRRGERGQALVEFALVLTVFLTLVFSIFDFALLLQSWVTIQHAAREGARFAVTGQVACNGVTDDRSACITQVARRATTGLYGGGPNGSAITVSYESWDHENGFADPPKKNDPGAQCDAIEVDVSYTYHFVTPFLKALAPGGLALDGRQRMLNEPFGPCSS
jgi:hypothetical protein